MNFLGILIGLALLVGGGTALVHGASQVAARLGVPPMIVGLTILAFGTSLPEFVVNVLSARSGVTDLAFGNVIGSNVANLALVLGIAAVIRPIEIHGQVVRRELPLLLLATSILLAMVLDPVLDGGIAQISRSEAVILVLVFGIFFFMTVTDLLRSRQHPDAIVAEIESSPIVPTDPKQLVPWLFIPAGIGMLYGGGYLAVEHSVALASTLGVSTTIIGLFVVAIGTSMPELVTSAIAAFRGESDLALGNVIGSNLFNTLAVLPASALVLPVAVPDGGTSDILLSLGFALALIPVFVLGRAKLGRATGVVFLAVFFGWALYRTFA